MHHAMSMPSPSFDENCLDSNKSELVLVDSDVYEPTLIEELREAYIEFCGRGADGTDKEVIKCARISVEDYYRRTRPFTLRFKRRLFWENDPIRRVAEDEKSKNEEKLRAVAKILIRIKDGAT